MKKEQLDTLLKDGDLWTNKDYQHYLSNRYVKDPKGRFRFKESKSFKGNHLIESGFEITIQGVEYRLDMKLYKALEQLFEYHVESCFEIDEFKEALNKKLLVYSTAKDDKIRLFNNRILEENKKLEDLIGDFWFIDPTVKSVKSLWCFWLLEEGEHLIECLKFDVFNGDKIEKIELGWPFEKHYPGLPKIWEYFHTEKMERIFLSVEGLVKIEYLKKLIEGLENPDKKTLSELGSGALAILCRIKRISIEGKNDAEEVIKKYIPLQPGKTFYKIVIEKYRKYAPGVDKIPGFLKDCDSSIAINQKLIRNLVI